MSCETIVPLVLATLSASIIFVRNIPFVGFKISWVLVLYETDNNLPTRIAFRVTSQIDSRTILDRKGAETLIGQGDMLFANNGSPDLVRAQGAYLSDEEIASVVEALKVNGEPQYAEEVQAALDASDDEDSDEIGEGEGGKYGDPVTAKAIMVIKASGKASTSLLQRKLGIGYGRAARIIDDLETRGLIGPDQGGGKRDLFLD